MDEERKRDRLRSFVIGGIVGAGAVIAAGRRGRPPKARPRPVSVGLAAFEDAPCYRELVDSERSDFDGS